MNTKHTDSVDEAIKQKQTLLTSTACCRACFRQRRDIVNEIIATLQAYTSQQVEEAVRKVKRDLEARMAHEDYVSCPTCDETLYHLQALIPNHQD